MAVWRQYPFGPAGPWAVASYAGLSLASVANAVLVPPDRQLLCVGATIVAATLVVELARRRFARGRGLDGRPFVPRRARHIAAYALAFGLPLVPALRGDLDAGWSGVALGGTLLGYELLVRRDWEAEGRPGDPRWRRDWTGPPREEPWTSSA